MAERSSLLEHQRIEFTAGIRGTDDSAACRGSALPFWAATCSSQRRIRELSQARHFRARPRRRLQMRPKHDARRRLP
jgi:hypothetical protein